MLACRARGYSRSQNGGWKNADQFSTELVYSAGAVISTVTDLYSWQNELLEGKIVSPQMLTNMTTPYLNNYGYGLQIDSLAHHRRISHGGAIPGFTSYLCSFPDDSVTVVVFSNNFSNSEEIAGNLANILFGLPVDLPHNIIERPINTKVLRYYTGKYQLYQSSGTNNFDLIENDGKLYLKPAGSGDFKMELKPESETLFFLAQNHDQKIEFIVDAKGSVKQCYLKSKGTKFDIKKVQ